MFKNKGLGIVEEEVELFSKAVLEDKGRVPCCQRQEEDEAEEHREKLAEEGVLLRARHYQQQPHGGRTSQI
ncbi:hypothetical protein P7K49_037635 [Saguinus oedipus]|uniref:Uncharacterized protein n=1 Tax=Saguinus oedipus TaxID=9490 RepID=A0ABQ9TIL0_SAGOE|nr:hypothetical protein P7K49_037635 [Saguinus oedipus]